MIKINTMTLNLKKFRSIHKLEMNSNNNSRTVMNENVKLDLDMEQILLNNQRLFYIQEAKRFEENRRRKFFLLFIGSAFILGCITIVLGLIPLYLGIQNNKLFI